jgi:hypothetical protein
VTKTLVNDSPTHMSGRAVLLAAVGALVGCQSPSIFGGSTGVLPMGPDTYTITDNVILRSGGGVAAQQKATTEGAPMLNRRQTLSFRTGDKPGGETNAGKADFSFGAAKV